MTNKYLIILLWCTVGFSGEMIPSWNHLDKEILALKSVTMTYEDLLASRIFQTLVKSPSKEVFLEMSQQNTSPLVVIAGLVGLKKHFPDAYMDTKLKVMMSVPDQPGNAGVFLGMGLKAEAQAGFKVDLSAIARHPVSNRKMFTLAVLALPQAMIEDWLRTDNLEGTHPTTVAFFVDRLLSDSEKVKILPAQRFKDVLATFARVPGYPRYIYAAYADESEPAYADALKAALADESVDSALVLVFRKTKYIRDNIDLAKIEMSDTRRKAINDLMERRRARQNTTEPQK